MLNDWRRQRSTFSHNLKIPGSSAPPRLEGRRRDDILDSNCVHTFPTRLEHEPGLKARRISTKLASLAVTFDISSCFNRHLTRGFVLLVFNIFCSLLPKEEKGQRSFAFLCTADWIEKRWGRERCDGLDRYVDFVNTTLQLGSCWLLFCGREYTSYED